MAFRFTIHGVPVRVQTGVRPLRWVRKHGITVGRTIFLAPHHTQVWPELLAHEAAHVKQFLDYGTLRFMFRYVSGLFLYGYGLKHPLERDAYLYSVENAHKYRDHVRSMGGLS